MINTLQTIVDFADCLGEHDKWSENAIEDYMGLKSDIDRLLQAVNNSGPEAIISLSLSSTTGAFNTVYTLCPLDVSDFTSGTDDYTVSGGVITVISAGTYEISYDCSVDEQAGSNRTEFISALFIDSVEAVETYGFMYSRQNTQGANTASCRIIKTLSALGTVEIRAKRNSGTNDGEFIAGGNRLLIRKVSV